MGKRRRKKKSKSSGSGCAGFLLFCFIGSMFFKVQEFITNAAENGTLLYIVIPIVALIALCIVVSIKSSHKTVSAEYISVDQMTGEQYERYCGHKILQSGFASEIEYTPTTNDYGADIIAYLDDGTKVVIQCKRYTGKVGNSAVQEVFAAIRHYHADTAMIITNSELTENARTLAIENGVEVVEHFR